MAGKIKRIVYEEVDDFEECKALRAFIADRPGYNRTFRTGDFVKIGVSDRGEGDRSRIGVQLIGRIGVVSSDGPDSDGDWKVFVHGEDGEIENIHVHQSRMTPFDPDKIPAKLAAEPKSEGRNLNI